MSSNTRPRISSLDGLRGLAIALVLVHHAVELTGVHESGALDVWVAKFAAELWAGVDLFFVLSGFLITGILLSTREAPGYFRNFYARRTLRIFPLYYATVLGMCVVLPALTRAPYLKPLADNQAWYWLYVPNFWVFSSASWPTGFFDHTWSLAIEEQFYLVWPLLVYLLGAKRLVPATLVMAASSVVLRVWMAQNGYAELQIRVLPFSHAEGLALGSLLATLAHNGMDREKLRSLSWGALLVGGAARLLLLAPVASVPLRENALVGTAWSICFAGLVGLAAFGSEQGLLAKALSARPLTFLGTYSYGLYLIHMPVMNFAGPQLARLKFLPHTLGVYTLAMLATAGLLSVMLAVVSYRNFELPFLRLKARFE